MATCARSHGGDGGDRPPRGRPTRIPRGCESSLPKKVRGLAADKNMHDFFDKNNKEKFELELDPKGTYKFVGENGSMFIRCLSNSIWKIPLHHASWEKVSENDKLRVYRTLNNFFKLSSWVDTSEWSGIRRGIDDECAKKYRDHKATSKKHFIAMGGYEDLENARKNHYERHTPVTWNRLIDNLYLDEKYRRRSEKNVENRKKQLYPSRGGSKSFASRRYEDMQTSGTIRLIDNWREMHFHPNKGWVTEKAEEHWKKIERERARMQEEAGDLPIDEEECLTRVLGPRRGWTRGIGRKVRRVGPDVSCVLNTTSQAEHNELKETVRLLTQNVEHLTAKVKKLENQESSQQVQDEDEGEDGGESENDF